MAVFIFEALSNFDEHFGDFNEFFKINFCHFQIKIMIMIMFLHHHTSLLSLTKVSAALNVNV